MSRWAASRLPQVADLVPAGSYDRETLLRVAASAEFPSEHPLARAIVERAEEEGLALEATPSPSG